MSQSIFYKSPGKQLALFPDVASIPANQTLLYVKGSNFNAHKRAIQLLVKKKVLSPITNVQFPNWMNSKLIKGGMKSKDLHKFLTKFKPSNNGKENVLIMDNLSAHKATKSCMKLGLSTIKELLESKNIEAIFLPPYTPQLNPVELCFNFIRHYVELKLVIDKIIGMLNEKDLTEYFRHCSEYN